MWFSRMTTAAFSSTRKMSRSYLQPRGTFGRGSGDKRKQSRLGAHCVHNWTSPVTSRSEQPTPVTHFAITCETSTAPSKNKISPNFLSLPFLVPFSTSERCPPTPDFTLADVVKTTLYLEPNTWLITHSRDVRPLHPDIDPTSSTRLGSSLTISGAREESNWL